MKQGFLEIKVAGFLNTYQERYAILTDDKLYIFMEDIKKEYKNCHCFK